MANEMPDSGRYSGLSRQVLQYSERFLQVINTLKQRALTDADWAPLEALVDVRNFKRVGVFLTPAVDTSNWQQYKDFIKNFGLTNTTLRLDTTFARDTRDSYLFPTRGMLQRVSAEVGTPPGSLQYYKLTFQNQQYFPLSKDFTLLLNGELGYGAGLGGKPLPFFKNLYAGGNGSVRGFSTATLGPKDANKNAIGGDQRAIANAELFFPLPGLKDDQSLRMSAFFDAGASFGPGDINPDASKPPRYGSFAFGDLRYSVGVAALWVSPLGPLKYSLAKPLAAQAGDKTEVFQFTFGNSF